MNEHFSWYRLGLLMRNDIVRGYRSFLTAGISLSIIMLLNALPGAAFGHVRVAGKVMEIGEPRMRAQHPCGP